MKNKLKEIRIKRGISQKELSEKTGISLKAISSYEQGSRDLRKASFENIVKIAKALECNVFDLF